MASQGTSSGPDPVRSIGGSEDRLVLVASVDGATAEQVFAALVEPARLTRWWAEEATTEPRSGGEYHLAWPAIGRDLRGRYLEFQPPSRLVMTWKWDQEPDRPERKVAFAVDERGSGCLLTVEHGTYGEGEAEAEDRESHLDGWMHFLGRLRTVMAEEDPDQG